MILSMKKRCAWCKCWFKLRKYNSRFCNRKCFGNYFSQKPNNGAFKPGQPSWNKGKYVRHSPTTEFKNGNIPWHTKPVGSVFIDSRNRALVKIAHPNSWKLRSHLVWEKHYGLMPHGSIVHHEDRDTLNDSISNLKVVTRGIHLKIHREEFEQKRAKAACLARWGH